MRVNRDLNPKRRFAVTFKHLGKLNPIDSSHLQDLISCFSALADATSDCDAPAVIGLAESGIVPSFAMHQACLEQGRSPRWFCTSREDLGGLKFREPHSHAPHHYLPAKLFDDPIDELWIVEDEITTGRTLANLLRCIGLTDKVQRVRVFALLDTRDANAAIGVRQMEVSAECVLRSCSNFWTESNPNSTSREFCDAPRQLVIGESIAAALPSLLSGALPRLQHVTLSPWLTDGCHIISRQEPMPGYYLYNANEPPGV